MKRFPQITELTALTRAPFSAALQCNGKSGFFEPLFGYERRIRLRACACDAMVERIEDAVDALVRARSTPTTIVRTERVPLAHPLEA